jgi:hypothetical protein
LFDHHYFVDWIFQDILSTEDYPAILFCNSISPDLSITSCTFINTGADSTSTSYAAVISLKILKLLTFSNNSFINIASTTSALFLSAESDCEFLV